MGTCVLHVFWCWLFIQKLELEMVGAAIALNLTYILNLLFLNIWLSKSDDFKDTWIPFTHLKDDKYSATQDWPVYLRVGFYGAILECLGWWNLQICFLFSGYLGIV